MVTPDVGHACMVVISSFVTRQVSIDKDAHIFILLHDSYQRPNCANLVGMRHERLILILILKAGPD